VNLTEVLIAPSTSSSKLAAARESIAALGVSVHQPNGAIAVEAARLRQRIRSACPTPTVSRRPNTPPWRSPHSTRRFSRQHASKDSTSPEAVFLGAGQLHGGSHEFCIPIRYAPVSECGHVLQTDAHVHPGSDGRRDHLPGELSVAMPQLGYSGWNQACDLKGIVGAALNLDQRPQNPVGERAT
jgi:hypothetical protein